MYRCSFKFFATSEEAVQDLNVPERSGHFSRTRDTIITQQLAEVGPMQTHLQAKLGACSIQEACFSMWA